MADSPKQRLIQMLEADDPEGAASALHAYVSERVKTWEGDLFSDGIILEPWKEGAKDRIVALMRAVAELSVDDAPPLDDRLPFIQGLIAIVHLVQNFSDLRARIASLKHWVLPPATRIWRVLAHLETILLYSRERATAAGMTEAGFDLQKAAQATVTTMGGGTASLTVAVESHVIGTESIVRMQQHRDKYAPADGAIAATASPFHDPDFEQLFTYAQVWHGYEYLWKRILFQRWRSVIMKEAIVWEPRDMNDLFLTRVGAKREQDAMSGLLTHAVVFKGESWRARVRALSESLTRQVQLPAPGDIWNMALDIHEFREFYAASEHRQLALFHVKTRHLGGVVERLADADPRIDWEIWLATTQLLHVLADLLLPVVTAHATGPEDHSMGTLALVTKARLAELLSTVSGMPLKRAVGAIEALCFDARRKHLTLYDQPLVPLYEGTVVLMPVLIASTNPAQSLENWLSSLPDKVFDTRGTPFELFLKKRLAALPGLAVAHQVKFDASDGRPVEYDLLVYWSGHLLILEAKCIKGILTPADEDRGERKLVEAFDQLDRRRTLVQSDWAMLRERALKKGLALPEAPPPDERVHTIAVLNEFAFTSRQRGRSVATDEFCLLRYFGERVVEKQSMGDPSPPREIVGVIRDEQEPTPEGFMAYLRAPPQVLHWKDLMDAQMNPLPAGKPPRLAFVDVELVDAGGADGPGAP